MAHNERHEVLILSETQQQLSDDYYSSQPRSHVSTPRSVSISIPMSSMESYESTPTRVGYIGPLRSEKRMPFSQTSSESSSIADKQFLKALYGDAKNWERGFFTYLSAHIPGVMNPHAQVVQRWNKFFVISCVAVLFIDPLFLFLPYVPEDYMCVTLNRPMTTTLIVFRSMADLMYLFHILLQFRLAYVAPDTRVIGPGDLIDHPKKIFLHYLRGYFFLDLLVVVPLPQILIFYGYAMVLLRKGVLVQYILRLYRVFPLLVGRSPAGLIFDLAWANFVINLLIFVLAGHVVGSCWYLLGLQRVDQCLRKACEPNLCDFLDYGRGQMIEVLKKNETLWNSWKKNPKAAACFRTNGEHEYGIYQNAVKLTQRGVGRRYLYSLFWGCQQISTLAGNQTPSDSVPEVLFLMGIAGLGLLLFGLLIGNIQSCLRKFIQPDLPKRLEMSSRRRDIEQWMSHRRLPQRLRRRVREAERYHWAATRGVNEEMLLEKFPEDLQRAIGRHLFKFVKRMNLPAAVDEDENHVFRLKFPVSSSTCSLLKLIAPHASVIDACHGDSSVWKLKKNNMVKNLSLVYASFQRLLLLKASSNPLENGFFKFDMTVVRIFAVMEDHIIDAICERLRQKIYIRGSKILHPGARVEHMIFIVRGKIESRGEDGVTSLCEGDFCGEELLAWCLESSSVNKDGRKIRPPGKWLLSNRTVTCVTNVEAFALRAEDLEEVTRIFARFLRKPRVQGAIRYVSPYWRGLAATRIQFAWRYKKKRLSRGDTSPSQHPSH